MPLAVDRDKRLLELWSSPYSESSTRPCPLCLAKSRTFHCAGCILAGRVGHCRRPERTETLAEKWARRDARRRHEDRLRGRLEAHATRAAATLDRLREQIRNQRQKVKYMGRLIKEKEDEVQKIRESTARAKVSNAKRARHLPRFEEKVNRIQCADTRYDADLKTRQMELTRKETELTFGRRKIAQELTTLIFPVEEFVLQSVAGDGDRIISEEDGDEEETASDDAPVQAKCVAGGQSELLADAIFTSYVHGTWVTESMAVVEMTQGGESHHRIGGEFGPHLPTSGNYRAYHSFAAELQTSGEGTRLTDTEGISPADTISAALSMTTQLVVVLAGLFHVILPCSLRLDDFNETISSRYRLAQRVTKLNFDVLYLCISQGVPSDRLLPRQTLHNVRLLIEHIQRPHTLVGKPQLALKDVDFLVRSGRKMVQDLKDVPRDLDDEDEDVDGKEGFGIRHAILDNFCEATDDWVAIEDDFSEISGLPRQSKSLSPPYSPTTSASTTNVAESMATSIVSSIFRGFT